MTWTIQHVAERILTETAGLLGDDIRKRQEAIVMTWLQQIERQAIERCAKIAEEHRDAYIRHANHCCGPADAAQGIADSIRKDA